MRQKQEEVEFYWKYVLPAAMRKIARLRAKGRKATAVWINESIVILHFKLVRIWRFRRERVKFEYRFDRKQRTVLLTAVDLDGVTHVDFAEKANSAAFMRLLSWLVEAHGDHVLVYVFLDRASYHSFIGSPLGSIKLVWLPRYAPDCNFDEQFHRFMKRELGLHVLTQIEDVKRVLAKYDGLRRPSLVRKARKIFLTFSKKFSKRHS